MAIYTPILLAFGCFIVLVIAANLVSTQNDPKIFTIEHKQPDVPMKTYATVLPTISNELYRKILENSTFVFDINDA